MKRVFYILLLVSFGKIAFSQPKVTVNGHWSASPDLIYAGLDYTPIESASNQTLINITDIPRWEIIFKPHIVNVHVKKNTNYPNEPDLWIKRTGTGNLSSCLVNGTTISGGTAYSKITTSDYTLFTVTNNAIACLGSATNIPIQYKMDISVLNPANVNYNYTITYTITNP